MPRSRKWASWQVIGLLSAACGDTDSVLTRVEPPRSLAAALVTGEGGFSADLVFDAEWGMGYCARVLLANGHPTASTSTWSVGLDLGASVTFTTYDGVFSANTGAVTVTPAAHNAVVPPDGTAQFGFCASIPSRGLRPIIVSVGSDLPPIEGEVVTREYKLPPRLDPLVNPNFQTELWASLYRPAVLEPGRRHALVVLLHGNHATCGRGVLPRFDDNSQYSETGTCPAGYTIVPNHRGFDYLGEDLAARGYFVVSVNANRGVNGVPSPQPESDELAIRPRAALVLRHLEQLSRWNDGSETTPPELGVNLTGRIDFGEVGLLGHSRGGEGVRLAYDEYTASSSSPWPALISSPVVFRGIFEIGPTDAPVDGAPVNAMGVPWNVLLPACDWDLRELPGVRPFDRMLSLELGDVEAKPRFKSFYHVWGTNHNYYNSEWHIADAGGGGTITGCINHAPLFDPAEFGSAAQRETGRFAAAAFFTANVGTERDAAANAVFDPAIALPVSYRVNRGYHPGGTVSLAGDAETPDSLVLEDFLGPTGISSYGLPNTMSGISIAHTELIDPHDPSLRVGFIQDVAASPSTFFQSNWATLGDGFDVSSYDYFDVRVDRSTTDVPATPVAFLVELVNQDDTRSSPLSSADFVELLPPPRSGSGRTLQTVRFPLALFQGAELEAIRAVRFIFDTPFEAGILLANMRATRDTTDLSPALAPLSGPALAPSSTVTLAQAAAEGAFDPEIVGTGNTVVSLTSSGPNAVTLTLRSQRFFDQRPRALVLSAGNERSVRALHPRGDLYTVQFTLDRRAFDRLGAREPLRVSYGESSPLVWDFGVLDKSMLGE